MIKYILIATVISLSGPVLTAALNVIELPRQDDEWGFRPATGETIGTTPAAFVWRPQPNVATYELEYARDPGFSVDCHRLNALQWNAVCPSQAMTADTWYWRMRFIDRQGTISAWSTTRSFKIDKQAVTFPMPPREELLVRVPAQHPRIFLRPEQLPELRHNAMQKQKPVLDAMIKQCEDLLKAPPDTSEPTQYPSGMQHGSKEWIKMWWGNRMKVIKVLDGAATLGFCYQLTGNQAYGMLAKKILLECAKWNPRGATGSLYNDEAGMPYLSRFSRTYSFVHDLLTNAERQQCRQVIAVRGHEFYQLLCPDHFYKPFVSHNNRAWHFLGEAGLVFKDEIPEAADWLYFAMTVYYCVYPVWGDNDGGWHEGLWYWSEYLERFFWWADIMKNTFNINIDNKPFFAQTGYYAMYLQPPHTNDGGFGDLAELSRGPNNANVMRALATLSGNPYWQWYADRLPVKNPESTYITFMRGTHPAIIPKSPADLPTSRCFQGNGMVFLNTDLTDGKNNVQFLFKSCPLGTASHGYDANNSFILNAFGERLLIHSGTRDNWASNFHQNWIWDTKSTNCITVDGQSQLKSSFHAKGEITAFATNANFDYTSGDAAASYNGQLKYFRRQILFCKPSAILIVDTLESPIPAQFTWHMHTINPMQLNSQNDVRVTNAGASCRVTFLYPDSLTVSQSEQFVPPPPDYLKQKQYHLTATIQQKTEHATFITLLQPYRTGQAEPEKPRISVTTKGWQVTATLPKNKLEITIDSTSGKITAIYGNNTFITPEK